MEIENVKISLSTRIQHQRLIRRISVLKDWKETLEKDPLTQHSMGPDFNLTWVKNELKYCESVILAAELLTRN